ncbi:MAG: ABC transporter permease [Candidatus Bathyarchaeia archaeon]
MLTFLVKRFVSLFPTAFLVVTIAFFLLRLIPGDPAAVMLGPGATHEQIEALRAELGLDKPIVIQYIFYVARLARGNLGESIYFRKPVLSIIVSHLEASFLLATLGLLVVILVGVVFGILSALFNRTVLDKLFLILALLGASIPSFWLGLMLTWVFGVYMRILPTSGFVSIFETGNLSNLKYLILPSITLGLVNSAPVARMTRSAVLDILYQPYIDVARAKGLDFWGVVTKHVLRNAAIPIVTVLAFVFGGMLAAAVVTENVFAVPGIGRLVVQSVLRRDYPVIQGVLIFVAALYILINFITDITYAFLDPRVRLT